MAQTQKHYIFTYHMTGDGATLAEAWRNCLDQIADDGLNSEPPEAAEVDWEECDVCGERDLPPGTGVHCEKKG